MTTARELVLWAEAAFDDAGLSFGHGTADARDEAVYIVFVTAGLDFDCAEEALDRPLPAAIIDRIRGLVQARIETRSPAAYLLGRSWFAGLEFQVDEAVLVPRSPIAELIETRYSPWVEPCAVRHLLDVGTGSGCIAIASALALPGARVDATDVSDAALAVAARNVAMHGVASRLTLHRADVFPASAAPPYDVIVSNPPYVPSGRIAELPGEYQREPRSALDGGADGLEIVHRLIDGAAERLAERGVLIVEVGEAEEALIAARPELPFTWLEFRHGGEGVFLLHRHELPGGA